ENVSAEFCVFISKRLNVFFDRTPPFPHHRSRIQPQNPEKGKDGKLSNPPTGLPVSSLKYQHSVFPNANINTHQFVGQPWGKRLLLTTATGQECGESSRRRRDNV
ncbi:hypothetical protein JZ751_015215, partial [Albula glossodonta]